MKTVHSNFSRVFLGAYDDEEAAAHAYDLAALKYWGRDTILNFPVAMSSSSLLSVIFFFGHHKDYTQHGYDKIRQLRNIIFSLPM